MQQNKTILKIACKLFKQPFPKPQKKSIPNKTVIIRPNDHPWITCRIKSFIRKRKRLYKNLNRQTTSITGSSLRQREIKLLILLDETILNTAKPSSKLFWKTPKQILKLNKSAQSVPTLIYNNETAETDLEKANMLNNYFASQSVVNDDNKSPPPLNTFVSHESLEMRPFQFKMSNTLLITLMSPKLVAKTLWVSDSSRKGHLSLFCLIPLYLTDHYNLDTLERWECHFYPQKMTDLLQLTIGQFLSSVNLEKVWNNVYTNNCITMLRVRTSSLLSNLVLSPGTQQLSNTFTITTLSVRQLTAERRSELFSAT